MKKDVFDINITILDSKQTIEFSVDNGVIIGEYSISFAKDKEDLVWKFNSKTLNASLNDAYQVIGSKEGWRRLINNIIIGEYFEDVRVNQNAEFVYELISTVATYVNKWITQNTLPGDGAFRSRINMDEYIIKSRSARRKNE